MQSPVSVPRGALYIASGVAAIAACYYIVYRNPSSSHIKSDSSLRRSNAVRRHRRRLRDDQASSEADSDAVHHAIESLRRREEAGQGYGTYDNRYFVTEDIDWSDVDDFILLPSRLHYIHETIAAAYSLPRGASERLLVHIQLVFLHRFLREECSNGHIIGSCANQLEVALSLQVPVQLIQYAFGVHNRGEHASFDEHSRLGVETAHDDPTVLAEALASEHGRRSSIDTDQEEDHTVRGLLYSIAEERARHSGYQHKGVECNGCGMQPIRGIRYHCANCWDYDLCESCEAQQIHHKTHVFYKIRIPAPIRGQIKLVQPKWYPGNPNACPESIPPALKEHLLEATSLDRDELDALYDQFKCIAGKVVHDDPDAVGMRIDRPSFDRYFTSTSADRPPNPNLIYDRIFAFYDQNSDGVISFPEFVKGMSELTHNTSREARIQRLFKAFDLDGDGYVDRKDFLYLLKANHQLHKELAHEMIYAREDAVMSEEDIREVIHANNPISTVFAGSAFPSHQSRHGEGKQIDMYGDLVLNGNGSDDVLREDSSMFGNRADAIARQATETRPAVQAHLNPQPRDEPVLGGTFNLSSDSHGQTSARENGDMEMLAHAAREWPNRYITEEDIVEALGTDLAIEEIVEPDDQQRVLALQRERLWRHLAASNHKSEQEALEGRWQRREFYTDQEEGFTKPNGHQELDSITDAGYTIGATVKYPQRATSTRRSGSSSSTELRCMKNTDGNVYADFDALSPLEKPVDERLRALESTPLSRGAGVEIIYEAVQEAFNNMLDHFFKDKEDEAIAAKASKGVRTQHVPELEAYTSRLQDAERRREKALIDADMERTQAMLDTSIPEETAVSRQVDLTPEKTGPPNGMGESVLRQPTALFPELTATHSLDTVECTLPQHRPNDPSFISFLGKRPDTAINESSLSTWHHHELIELEAKERGGFGRLDKREFRKKLREDNCNGAEIDIGAEGHEDEFFWEERADLGRFSFLSTWIEMASF